MATKEELLSLYEKLARQEDRLCFTSFSRQDALTLGLRLVKLARARKADLAIEITVNGTVWFSCLVGNATANNIRWIARKRRTVDMMEMSSYRYGVYLDLRGQDFTDLGLDPKDYTGKGGGFPLRIADSGVVGTICVSGLPNVEDHELITGAVADMLHVDLAEESYE